MLTLIAMLLSLVDQTSSPPIRILNPTNNQPNPGDMRLAEFDTETTGSSWRVFSVNADPRGPLVITQVQEVRQQNPPSTFAVFVGNRDYLPINSLTIAAAVVDVTGKVKATQTLPSYKNLKPGQVWRKETPIRVTIVAPTDRIVFYVKEFKSEKGDWSAAQTEVAELIRKTALKLPVP